MKTFSDILSYHLMLWFIVVVTDLIYSINAAC